jgi:hypothetical protein
LQSGLTRRSGRRATRNYAGDVVGIPFPDMNGRKRCTWDISGFINNIQGYRKDCLLTRHACLRLCSTKSDYSQTVRSSGGWTWGAEPGSSPVGLLERDTTVWRECAEGRFPSRPNTTASPRAACSAFTTTGNSVPVHAAALVDDRTRGMMNDSRGAAAVQFWFVPLDDPSGF